MDSPGDLQQQEITVLKSIYDEDFLESPPPKAWKGAARLLEFIIKVRHPEPIHSSKIFFHLHTKFPRTYPSHAIPLFTIQKPVQGLSNDQTMTLSHAIHVEAQKNQGEEMVFQIITFSQEWIKGNVKLPMTGSLASEMNKRASEEEKAKQDREAQEAEQEHLRTTQFAEQLNEQIKADAQRLQLAKERHDKARKRAHSDATEMPPSGDTFTESFSQEIVFSDVTFNTVKIFHPRREYLGVTYLADPVCDDVHATLPLELYTVTFDEPYYTTSQGRKKLKQLEAEIQRLTSIRHCNLLTVVAVKLDLPYSSDPPRLVILSEQHPPLSLKDVLEDCEHLREERAFDYLVQILSALNVVHTNDLVHRGINARCIGLATRDPAASSKLIKLGKVGFHTRLLDLHKSNPLNNYSVSEPPIPESWLSKEAVDSPLTYTRSRDLHDVGVVLLQILLGHDVMERFPDAQSALQSTSISERLRQHAVTMLVRNTKDPISCFSILAELSESSLAPTKGTLPIVVPAGLKTPIAPNYPGGSPEVDYFKAASLTRQSSRWKQDFEELELLGKGAFGSVVKARNLLDSRIYAVKKVKLRTMQRDNRIFREVNTLSRLSHRFIVRYYTTWVETSESTSLNTFDSSGSTSETEDGVTSVPHSGDRFSIDLDDLDDFASDNKFSFPSIHFGGSTSSKQDEDEDSDSDNAFKNLFRPESNQGQHQFTPLAASRTLYIQMEFVERQTLKERVAEGLSEDEAWRLFQQILEALVYMSGLGILHRDIKLTNIFIDSKGDCKVGDFGLATSSLAAVDPTDVSPVAIALDTDMTFDVGTKLYIAPEVQSRARGPRNHTKADMYSLGIVFFEMNYMFLTGAERTAVIEELRKPEIRFPPTWRPHLDRQRKIITWLLQHDLDQRPSALELSQSPLLPQRLEDEYFKEAIRMMAKADSPHHQAVLSALFTQPPRQVRGFLYDHEAQLPEHASLNGIVEERLAAIFRLRGAVDITPPLLMPVMQPEDQSKQATFLDRHGDVVTLPKNLLVPLARLAARSNLRRIKRSHIADVYRPNTVSGHPKIMKAAVLDIITPDLIFGPIAAVAEALTVANDCLNSFPNLAQNYDVRISHSKIVDLVLSKIPYDLRSAVLDIITQSKSSPSQKRASLLKKGLLRSTTDELEVLCEADIDIDELMIRLDKTSPNLALLISPFVDDIKQTILFATYAGFDRPIFFHPLMLGSHHAFFKDGIRFEVVRNSKRVDILAAGGRYDHLISRYTQPKPVGDLVCAVGIQFAVDKITAALAVFQSTSVKTLVKEQRSFGFWSPRRCDVYVVSYQPGYLQDRLETAAYLWQHNISSDVMYESGLPDRDHENYIDICLREGILFTVYPRPRTSRRDQAAFRVKSVLKGTETDLSRQELVSWLLGQIGEQKRIDALSSGISSSFESSQGLFLNRDVRNSSDVQLLLPGDAKKQRKQTKQLFLDRAFDAGERVKSAIQGGMSLLAVDVPSTVFDSMTINSSWVTDEDQWRSILAKFPTQHSPYAHQVREAVVKRKAEGHDFILLFSVKEERIHILTLP